MHVFKKSKFSNRCLGLFGIASLIRFIFRRGTKPSRVLYAFQKAAIVKTSMLLVLFIPLWLASMLTRTKKFLSKKGIIVLMLFLIANIVLNTGQFLQSIKLAGATDANQELHTDGRWIKNTNGDVVLLRGLWKAEFADSCVGWWTSGGFLNWSETNVRSDMQILRDVYKVNVFNTFIWGDWWIENKSVTLSGATTDQNYRFALKETARLAAEYDLYFQIRLYGCNQADGRIEGLPFQPTTSWTVADFANFWGSVANEMKDYPNVIFTLFDEPTDYQTEWFYGSVQAINAIRSTGAQNLIVVHFGYCGDCMWIEDWVQQDLPTQNIVFSNHIYRFHGTYAYNPNAPTDYPYILNFLTNAPSGSTYTGAGYGYITETYDVPIWASAVGAYNGATNGAEYTAFNNTLFALNELELSYCAYQWFRTDTVWTIGYETPNRVGQALIDAITAASTPTPSPSPTFSPSPSPTTSPSFNPKSTPTPAPTVSPFQSPTLSPSPDLSPTPYATLSPEEPPTIIYIVAIIVGAAATIAGLLIHKKR